MIALIDYDAGNIKSVEKAFQSLGKEVVLTREPDVLKRAAHVVLPGVGFLESASDFRSCLNAAKRARALQALAC